MPWGGDNELSLCLNKAISIYIYKITSHKYIWQDSVFIFWQRGEIRQHNVCASIIKCQSKWLSDNSFSRINKIQKRKKMSSCTIKSNGKTQKHP